MSYLNKKYRAKVQTETTEELTARLDKFIETERNNNVADTWSKLDKTTKLLKLTNYAGVYRDENNLTEQEYENLIVFFKDCLNKKRLSRVKDVSYNKDSGEIKLIPALTHNKQTNHYTLKNIDKRVSTLKGLPTKKKNGTIRNIATVATAITTDANDETA